MAECIISGRQGPKGDKGDTGAKGATGATGAQGPTGPAGASGIAATWYNGKPSSVASNQVFIGISTLVNNYAVLFPPSSTSIRDVSKGLIITF